MRVPGAERLDLLGQRQGQCRLLLLSRSRRCHPRRLTRASPRPAPHRGVVRDRPHPGRDTGSTTAHVESGCPGTDVRAHPTTRDTDADSRCKAHPEPRHQESPVARTTHVYEQVSDPSRGRRRVVRRTGWSTAYPLRTGRSTRARGDFTVPPPRPAVVGYRPGWVVRMSRMRRSSTRQSLMSSV